MFRSAGAFFPRGWLAAILTCSAFTLPTFLAWDKAEEQSSTIVRGDTMASQLVVNEKVAVSKVWYGAALLVVAALTWPAPQAFGKEPSLTAIELYDGPTGAAYVQLGDVSING